MSEHAHHWLIAEHMPNAKADPARCRTCGAEAMMPFRHPDMDDFVLNSVLHHQREAQAAIRRQRRVASEMLAVQS